MQSTQKVTVNLPAKLIETSQALTGKGITETLIIALEKLVHAQRKILNQN